MATMGGQLAVVDPKQQAISLVDVKVGALPGAAGRSVQPGGPSSTEGQGWAPAACQPPR